MGGADHVVYNHLPSQNDMYYVPLEPKNPVPTIYIHIHF